MSHKITLYQFEMCPFCARVRAKLDEMGLKYKKVNVERDREDKTRVMIAEKSGVQSVPVIEIDGEWIGDSGVIIEHLEKLNG